MGDEREELAYRGPLDALGALYERWRRQLAGEDAANEIVTITADGSVAIRRFRGGLAGERHIVPIDRGVGAAHRDSMYTSHGGHAGLPYRTFKHDGETDPHGRLVYREVVE